MKCYLCGGEPAWSFPASSLGGFFGNARMLYHYGRLLRADNRYPRPGTEVVWGCDACQIAGIDNPDDPHCHPFAPPSPVEPAGAP